jgi:hypothetical protein
MPVKIKVPDPSRVRHSSIADADFACTWAGFVDVQAFRDRTATAGRARIFTTT